MNIVMAHNFYQLPGGEDRVFAEETKLLEAHNHAVKSFTLHNDSIDARGRMGILRDMIWNRRAAREIGALVGGMRAEIAHFHNTFPLISPAACAAARAAGAAVVLTLHNYRLFCPAAVFLRNGKTCEDCLGRRVAWPAALHKCYRSSRSASTATAAMLAAHRLTGVFNRAVDLFVVPSQFARRKFVQGGLPEEKLVVKPHFVDPDPGPGPGDGEYGVFVGRLSEEKGMEVLLEGWSRVSGPQRLLVVGDGPFADRFRRASVDDRRIELLGWKTSEEVSEIVGRAAFLVMPSTCYETFGLTIVEALARGTPAVASRMGAMAEAVEDGLTGLLFDPGNPVDLADKVMRLRNTDTAERRRMRQAARAAYIEKYTAGDNYGALMSIYERALSRRWAERPCRRARECPI